MTVPHPHHGRAYEIVQAGYAPGATYGDRDVVVGRQVGLSRRPLVAALTSSTWGHADADFAKIKQAWDQTHKDGVHFFDTAEVYGNGESERIIRRLITESSPEVRANVVLATKWLPVPTARNFFILTPGVVAGLRGSLERLGLDSVDLYMIHGPIGPHSWEAQGRELAQCYKLGLTRNVGVSNFSEKELRNMHAILKKYDVPLASNQIEFSLLRQLPEKNGLLAAMKELGVACMAYSPLGMGRLTGKYSKENPPPKGRRFSDMPMEQLEPLLDVMRKLASKYHVPTSAIAINWVIQKGAIPLGGARDAHQAEQNAKALTFNLTPEDVDELSSHGFDGKNSIVWQHG